MGTTTRRGVRRAVALAGTAVLATTVLVGCSDDGDNGDNGDGDNGDGGSAEPFADEDGQGVIDAGFDALEGADSFRVQGSFEEDGETQEIDLSLDADGNCTGNLSSDTTGDFEVVGVEGSYWLRASAEFWNNVVGPEAGALLGDAWVPDESGEFGEICSIDGLLDSFDDRELDGAEKGDTVDTDEGEAIEVNGTDSDDNDVTVRVLVDDPTYIVAFESSETGELTVSEFDEPVDSEEPPADEVVDLTELAG